MKAHYWFLIGQVIAVSSFSESANTQNVRRESPPRVETGEVLSELSGAIGWHKNDAGEWCKHLQKIASCTAGPYADNYEKLQLRRVSSADVELVMLLVSSKDYKYTYPALGVGPHDIHPTNFGIIDARELRGIFGKSWNSPYTTQFDIKFWGQIESLNEEMLRLKTATWVNGVSVEDNIVVGFAGFTLWPVLLDNVKLMRFVPEICVTDRVRTPKCKVNGVSYRIEREYYEVPYQDFVDFVERALEQIDHKVPTATN